MNRFNFSTYKNCHLININRANLTYSIIRNIISLYRMLYYKILINHLQNYSDLCRIFGVKTTLIALIRITFVTLDLEQICM